MVRSTESYKQDKHQETNLTREFYKFTVAFLCRYFSKVFHLIIIKYRTVIVALWDKILKFIIITIIIGYKYSIFQVQVFQFRAQNRLLVTLNE